MFNLFATGQNKIQPVYIITYQVCDLEGGHLSTLTLLSRVTDVPLLCSDLETYQPCQGTD